MFELYFSQLYNSFFGQDEHNIEIFSIEDFKEEFNMLTYYCLFQDYKFQETKTFHEFSDYIKKEAKIPMYNDNDGKSASRMLVNCSNDLIKTLINLYNNEATPFFTRIWRFPLFIFFNQVLIPDTRYINQLQKQNAKQLNTNEEELNLYNEFCNGTFLKKCPSCSLQNCLKNSYCPICLCRTILNAVNNEKPIPIAKYFSYKAPDFFILYNILNCISSFPQINFVRQNYSLDSVKITPDLLIKLYNLYHTSINYLADKDDPLQAVYVYEWFDQIFSFNLFFSIIKDIQDKDPIITKYTKDDKTLSQLLTCLTYFQELPSSTFKAIAYTKFKDGLKEISTEHFTSYCVHFTRILVHFTQNLCEPYFSSVKQSASNLINILGNMGNSNIIPDKNSVQNDNIIKILHKKHFALKEHSKNLSTFKETQKDPILLIPLYFYQFIKNLDFDTIDPMYFCTAQQIASPDIRIIKTGTRTRSVLDRIQPSKLVPH